MMKHFPLISILLAACLGLAACGQKGPLYLPAAPGKAAAKTQQQTPQKDKLNKQKTTNTNEQNSTQTKILG